MILQKFFINNAVTITSLAGLGLDTQVDTLYKLLKQKEIAAAVNSYNELRNKFPDDYDFSREQLNRLGVYLRNMRKLDESITVYKWMIQLYPDWWEVYNGIADVYRFNEENQKAIKYYAKSLEMNPDFDYAKEIAATIEELSNK
jgi:tetratricopeptide (TPR) repeat protein